MSHYINSFLKRRVITYLVLFSNKFDLICDQTGESVNNNQYWIEQYKNVIGMSLII